MTEAASTALIAAVDIQYVLAAIVGVGVLKIAPGVAKWGYNKIIGWFR